MIWMRSLKFRIRGFIDRLAYNLKTEEYEIHDYKTSNTMPKEDKIESDRQLALYSIAVKEMFGKRKRANRSGIIYSLTRELNQRGQMNN